MQLLPPTRRVILIQLVRRGRAWKPGSPRHRDRGHCSLAPYFHDSKFGSDWQCSSLSVLASSICDCMSTSGLPTHQAVGSRSDKGGFAIAITSDPDLLTKELVV